MLTLLLVLLGPYDMSPPPVKYQMAVVSGYGMAAQPLSYADAYAEALRSGKRLATFVGVPSRPIDGVVTVSVPWEGAFREYRNGAVVVSVRPTATADWLEYLGEVSPTTPDREIREGGRKAVTTPSADPFRFVQQATSTENCST